MAKNKTAAAKIPAALATIEVPVQQQTIQDPEALKQADQEPVINQQQAENLISRLQESGSGTITSQEPVVSQEPAPSTSQPNPMFATLPDTEPVINQETQDRDGPDPETSVQNLPSENLPLQKKTELTFEEKVKLKALSRNAARSVNKFKDALLSLINPDQPDDNPDRA